MAKLNIKTDKKIIRKIEETLQDGGIYLTDSKSNDFGTVCDYSIHKSSKLDKDYTFYIRIYINDNKGDVSIERIYTSVECCFKNLGTNMTIYPYNIKDSQLRRWINQANCRIIEKKAKEKADDDRRFKKKVEELVSWL